jgi:hypothetical protein
MIRIKFFASDLSFFNVDHPYFNRVAHQFGHTSDKFMYLLASIEPASSENDDNLVGKCIVDIPE